jgi:hypothetical protein
MNRSALNSLSTEMLDSASKHSLLIFSAPSVFPVLKSCPTYPGLGDHPAPGQRNYML